MGARSMKAGRLRHRIRIETVENGLDTLGAPTKDWGFVAEVAADIRCLSGREYFGAGRDIGDETYKIVIRGLPGFHLDGTYRATDVDTGAVYSISGVLESHTRDMLTLLANAGGEHA